MKACSQRVIKMQKKIMVNISFKKDLLKEFCVLTNSGVQKNSFHLLNFAWRKKDVVENFIVAEFWTQKVVLEILG